MMTTTQAGVLPVPLRRFPGLHTGPLSKRRIYLDSACVTPTPAEVGNAAAEFYEQPPGCPLRSNSDRSGLLERRIRDARDCVRRFLNAKFSDEIVITPNTTFSINLVASAFARRQGKVLLTDLEHNSNRLPWLGQERIELPWPPDEPFPLDAYRRHLRNGIKLVSITAMSNVTGASPPLSELLREARGAGVPVHLDAAQAFAGGSIDVAEDRPDFVSFSLHKAYGPSGLGGLYIRREWQPRLLPWISGAGTVDDHFEETSTWAAGAARFEFGLQNYAAIFAVPAAMAFLSDISQGALNEHAAGLNMELRDALRRVPDCHSVGPLSGADAHHICSFHVRDTDSKRLASLLDMAANIQVRAGRLCAHHWFHRYGVPDVIRVSLGGHNSISDVEEFVNALVRIRRHYM